MRFQMSLMWLPGERCSFYCGSLVRQIPVCEWLQVVIGIIKERVNMVMKVWDDQMNDIWLKRMPMETSSWVKQPNQCKGKWCLDSIYHVSWFRFFSNESYNGIWWFYCWRCVLVEASVRCRLKPCPSLYKWLTANITCIHTSSTKDLTLNISMCWNFMWTFIQVGVQTPNLEVDFLVHFNLLVNMK